MDVKKPRDVAAEFVGSRDRRAKRVEPHPRQIKEHEYIVAEPEEELNVRNQSNGDTVKKKQRFWLLLLRLTPPVALARLT